MNSHLDDSSWTLKSARGKRQKEAAPKDKKNEISGQNRPIASGDHFTLSGLLTQGDEQRLNQQGNRISNFHFVQRLSSLNEVTNRSECSKKSKCDCPA
jgi:hypothetical protein